MYENLSFKKIQFSLLRVDERIKLRSPKCKWIIVTQGTMKQAQSDVYSKK